MVRRPALVLITGLVAVLAAIPISRRLTLKASRLDMVPLGTVLGVCTLMVLLRESVRPLYEPQVDAGLQGPVAGPDVVVEEGDPGGVSERQARRGSA